MDRAVQQAALRVDRTDEGGEQAPAERLRIRQIRIEILSDQQGAQAQIAGHHERRDAHAARDCLPWLRRGIQAERRAGRGRHRMRPDRNEQRVEPEHRAQPHRQIEIAIFEKLKVGDEARIGRPGMDFVKRAEAVAERAGVHNA